MTATVRKRYLKSDFALLYTLFRLFHLFISSNVGKFVFRPPQNVKLGTFNM